VNRAPDFDRLAGAYRWLEYLSFGPILERCRCHYLPQLAACRSALILGDGDGRFTARLLQSNPKIQIAAIDLSAAMLAALQKRAAEHASRVTIHQADLRAWSPPSGAQYDLVATHFFLDCLSTPEVAALVQRIRPALAPRALWVLSDFAIPATLFGRAVAAPLVAALYRAFRLLTGLPVQSLPDHRAALTAAGFTLQSSLARLNGLLVSELWQSPV
jgi:SAM-dependent methyltransferase